MKTEAVIFDYGNVFVKDKDKVFFKYVSDKISKPVEEVSEIITAEFKDLFRGTITEDVFWNKVLDKLDYKGNDSFSNVFEEVYYSEFAPDRRILDVVKKIREKGIKTGILSNMILPLVNVCRSQGYFDGFYPVITSAETKGYMKPEKPIYLKLFDFLGISLDRANELVYVDDKEKYLVPASGLGMRVALFDLTKSSRPKKDLETKLREVGIDF